MAILVLRSLTFPIQVHRFAVLCGGAPMTLFGDKRCLDATGNRSNLHSLATKGLFSLPLTNSLTFFDTPYILLVGYSLPSSSLSGLCALTPSLFTFSRSLLLHPTASSTPPKPISRPSKNFDFSFSPSPFLP